MGKPTIHGYGSGNRHPYDQAILQAAFDLVKDTEDWKNDIYGSFKEDDGTEPITLDRVSSGYCTKDLMHEAIIHFTATVPTFSPLEEGRIHVEADGYRAGPCGDF